VNDLLKAGDKLILENKYDEAIKMFEEAFGFDKWKELYGGTILSNLAYAQALKGNMVMAKHYNSEYQTQYGDYGVDSDEADRLEIV